LIAAPVAAVVATSAPQPANTAAQTTISSFFITPSYLA
jgi:hypothetical protein